MAHWITTTTLAAALLSASWATHAASWGDTLRQQAAQLGGNSSAETAGSSGSSALGGLLGGGTGASALSALGLGGLSSPGTAGNAAGVLTYCMKNNYLNADKAQQVKDQLLGKMGFTQRTEPKETGYQNGLLGMVTGADGQSFSLDKIKGDLKKKACDFVLDNASSLL